MVNWTPLSKWYMVRLVGFEKGHQKDTLHDEIELCVQYIERVLNPSHMKLTSPHSVHLNLFRRQRNPCIFVEAAKLPWMGGR